MNRFLSLTAGILLALSFATAQNINPMSKLSPHLRMLVSGDPAQAAEAGRSLIVRTGPQHPRPTISAFIRFQGDADNLRADFASAGASIHTVVGNLATAEIPIPELTRIANLPEVLKVDESRQLKLNTDVSVPATGANQVWYGAGGPVDAANTHRGAMPPPWQGNTGKGTIVGILDTGLDLNHKDFLDTFGKTRVLSLWDQTAKKGTPPSPLAGYPAFSGNECSAAQIEALHQKTDLVVMGGFDESISLLPGNGNGFGAPVTTPKGHSPVAAAVADFDRDGNMDIVTANLDGTISWVQGDGHGGFVPQAPIDVAGNSAVQITYVATGDFNRDGFPDVVAVANNANAVAILLGNGDGTFQTAKIVGVGGTPSSVVVADFDGDGIQDIAVANYDDGDVTILIGQGDGTFANAGGSPFPITTIAGGQNPSQLAAGDFNGDGIPDLAVVSWGRGSGNIGADLTILLGKGDGTFGPPSMIDTHHFELSIALGDFNRDGKLDIALTTYSNWATILLGNGDGTFGTPTDYSVGTGSTGLYYGQATVLAGDFNGDGLLDVVNLYRSFQATASKSYYDSIAFFPGKGDGTLGTPVQFPSGSTGNSTFLATGNFHSSVCTEVDTNGHGTNVAGIAAGNGSAGGSGPLQTPYRYVGMAPEAPLIIVKSPFDDTNLIDGVAYIFAKAKSLNTPAVVNLSLGGGIGPHDGTSNLDTMLSGLAGPGEIIVAATGNDADSNLHSDGTLANGTDASISLEVPAGVTKRVSVDIWYPGADTIGVSLLGPNGESCTGGAVYAGTGSQVAFQDPACGTGGITVYPIDPVNGDHNVFLSLSTNPVPSGSWTITLTGRGCGSDICVTNGQFDVWSNGPCGTTDCVHQGGIYLDAAKSINEPGSGTNIISVGSYVTKTSWIGWGTDLVTPVIDTGGTVGDISTFSGLGPRRICSSPVCGAQVQKPDIAAPGEEIFAAYSADSLTDACGHKRGACLDPDAQHIAYQGTSMATPHVTGAIALLLSKYNQMSPCQVKASLTNARTDHFVGGVPNSIWGYGKLAIDQAIFPSPVPNKTAPNVVFQTLAAARASVLTAGLVVGGVSYAGSTTVPVGEVMQQAPAAGTSWCGAVDLVLSGVKVPDVSGQTVAAATGTILNANLTWIDLIPTDSSTIPVGKAIGTTPPAGTYVAPGAPVKIYVSGIQVPDVTGMTKAAAAATLSAAQLFAGVLDYEGSQTVPVGSVISQDPFAGTEVLPISPVNLTISGIPVPDVTGKALSTGKNLITGANLTVGAISAAAPGTVTMGSVISENPAAGTYVDIAAAVALVVSGATVPNEIGQNGNTAQSAIVAAGLTVGSVTQAGSPNVPAGVVMVENPGGGTVQLPGTPVDLVVSTGQSGQNIVPNVVGLVQANATTAINNAGLTVGTVTNAFSSTIPSGSVISESPVAGTAVNAGTSVSLVISSGVASLQSIRISPASPSVGAGGTLQLAATGTLSGNTTQNLTSQVTWTSSVPGVAAINPSGLVTARGIGTTTITAKLGSVAGTTTLTVTAPANCDTNGDGSFTNVDVQNTVGPALGLAPTHDVNGDGVTNVLDVQISVNAVLTHACTAH